MTEGVLIEIAQRFRWMEDIVEAADVFHAERVERAKDRLDKAEDSYKKHKNYNRFCRESAECETERDSIQTVRNDLEKALDACREDMVSMQETIRRREPQPIIPASQHRSDEWHEPEVER